MKTNSGLAYRLITYNGAPVNAEAMASLPIVPNGEGIILIRATDHTSGIPNKFELVTLSHNSSGNVIPVMAGYGAVGKKNFVTNVETADAIPSTDAIVTYLTNNHGKVINVWTGTQTISNIYNSPVVVNLPTAVKSSPYYKFASQLEFVFYNSAAGNTSFTFPKYYQGARYPDSTISLDKSQTYIEITQASTKYYAFRGLKIRCQYDKTTREIVGLCAANNVDFIRTTNQTSTTYNWSINTEKGTASLSGINLLI